MDTLIGSSIVATLPATGVTGHLTVAGIPSPDDRMEIIGALAAAIASVGGGGPSRNP